jgi:chitodextrinase
VSYTDEDDDGVLRGAIFTNSWYINPGIAPTFYPGSTGWVKEGPTLLLANAGDTTGDIESNPQWHLEAAYTGGNIVAYESVCYRAKWWTRGQIPTSDGSPWEIVGCGETETIIDPNQMVEANTDNDADSGDSDGGSGSSTPSEAISQWAAEGVFIARSVVQMDNVCYQANWWTQGDEPVPASELTNIWDSPWEEVDPCPAQAIAPPDSGSESGAGGSGGIDKMPAPIVVTEEGDDSDMAATEGAGDTTDNLVTPVVPPVVPVAMDDEPVPAPAVPVELPSEGYEFLRQVTNEHWNWMFPLRSGRYVAPTAGGGTRNSEPFANPDGSTDTFDLNAFIRATLAYNAWAEVNGYKQFLNQGTVKQQAEEFLIFWAKSSRETSGSWATASSPWIENYEIAGESITAWKGGLYWVEEVGYSTDSATGKSAAINYVDTGSTVYPPAPGRSYYGRGVIQLSWNYNYGAFNHWLYDNGLFADLITERDTLLRFPNLVAENGALSILSGIWFWMTPQGAKPASQDVVLGEVSNISQSTQDLGLPQTNSGYEPATADGDTTDPEVFAYRVGTVINIVNGGLECHRAARWHGGPPQRASYYNAYAAYFNDQLGVGATRIPEATNVWNVSVTEDSPVNLQSATCFNQKSYYGW